MTLLKTFTIRLDDNDNVVVAVIALETGQKIPEANVICQNNIPEGHKVATESIRRGETIKKYGQIIGTASRDIKPGEHVHTQNMEMLDYERNYIFGTEARPSVLVSEEKQVYFQGIVRADGQVATRNYIGVIATANCSSSVARFIADAFDSLEAYVDHENSGFNPFMNSIAYEKCPEIMSKDMTSESDTEVVANCSIGDSLEDNSEESAATVTAENMNSYTPMFLAQYMQEPCELISIGPSFIRAGKFLPKYRLITITGDEFSEFDADSKVTIGGRVRVLYSYAPNPNTVRVLIKVPPGMSAGDYAVSVTTGDEVCIGLHLTIE